VRLAATMIISFCASHDRIWPARKQSSPSSGAGPPSSPTDPWCRNESSCARTTVLVRWRPAANSSMVHLLKPRELDDSSRHPPGQPELAVEFLAQSAPRKIAVDWDIADSANISYFSAIPSKEVNNPGLKSTGENGSGELRKLRSITSCDEALCSIECGGVRGPDGGSARRARQGFSRLG
jgi:hypothetical protein